MMSLPLYYGMTDQDAEDVIVAVKKIVDYFCTIEYQKYDSSNWNNSIKSNIIPHTFRVDWAPNNTPGLTGDIGAFYPVEDEGLYLVGKLTAK